jgi:predicted nucleic acid-binding protein
MSIVIDASVALAWSFGDERTEKIVAVLDRVSETGAMVPALWRLEVANSLRSALRRGRITGQLRDETISDLLVLGIECDTDTNMYAWDETLRLADRHDLTPYDACYLELAQRMRLPLATLDHALHTAAV